MPVTIKERVETGHRRYLDNQQKQIEKETFKNEITSLKKEVEDLKQERSHKSRIRTRRQEMTSLTSKPAPQKNFNNDTKNEEGASRRTGDPQQQIQLKDVVKFIQKTMVILSDYEKQLRGQFSSETIPTEM